MSHNYNRDLYKILNIDYNASLMEIKSAYRKLVRLYHPDVAGENADEAKFKEIQEAYEVLSNTESRKKYDLVHGYYRERLKKDFERKREEKYNEYFKQAKMKSQPNNENNQEQPKEKKDSFSQSINEALDSLFHTQNKQSSKENSNSSIQAKNGDDIKTDVTISALEAIEGTVRKVNILHTEPCPSCESRKIINGAQCSVCGGTGQLQTRKTINVKIPKGVKQGSKVRIRKEGNKGINGGKNGDLYLIINIEKDKYFEINGNDIYITLPVTPSEAALGCELHIEILNEALLVKIPPLTSSGQKLRLTGLGIENKTKTQRGDVIITVMIKIPTTISSEEKLLYQQLHKLTTYDIRKDFKNAK